MRQSVLDLVEEELDSAIAKWPHWPYDTVHAAAIVAERAGELVQAALRYTYEDLPRSAVEQEAIHVAAMAFRFLNNLYEMKRLRSPCLNDSK